MIPFYKPNLTEADAQAAKDLILSGRLTTGEKVGELEKAFAEYVGAPYCVATSSLTSGYLAVLDLLTPKAVNLPSSTYISMANIPKKMGMRIEFRDEIIAGRAYDIFTDKGTIVDSAHEIKKDGFVQGKIFLYSFHATKILTTIQGGMIATDSKDFADYLRIIQKDGRLMGLGNYVVQNPGWNSYLSDVQAALGLSQLVRIEHTLAKRREIAARYRSEIPTAQASDYLVQLKVRSAPMFREAAKPIFETSQHFPPIHLQPAYFGNWRLPVTEETFATTVSLPFFETITDEEIKEVAKLANQWRI